MYLLQQEEKQEAELVEAQADFDWRSRIFAADTIPTGWKIYEGMFPSEGTVEAEMGGRIEEIVPQSERELQQMVNRMKREGMKFAE